MSEQVSAEPELRLIDGGLKEPLPHQNSAESPVDRFQRQLDTWKLERLRMKQRHAEDKLHRKLDRLRNKHMLQTVLAVAVLNEVDPEWLNDELAFLHDSYDTPTSYLMDWITDGSYVI